MRILQRGNLNAGSLSSPDVRTPGEAQVTGLALPPPSPLQCHWLRHTAPLHVSCPVAFTKPFWYTRLSVFLLHPRNAFLGGCSPPRVLFLLCMKTCCCLSPVRFLISSALDIGPDPVASRQEGVRLGS